MKDKLHTELPDFDKIYSQITFEDELSQSYLENKSIEIRAFLIMIGKQLGFRTWVAQNDKGIIYQNKKLGEFEGIIAKLEDEILIKSHHDAVKAALLIDCIWFKNGRLMPAVMEIEHSTGVTSGLTRMKNFYDRFPPFPTRYVVVAADEDRNKVVQEANKPQFADLQTKFFPYSAVEELYALCQRRKLKGVTEEFLDCYLETIVN